MVYGDLNKFFEVIINPYSYYEGEPYHLCRFIEDGKAYLCGWDDELKAPIMVHSHSVIKQAKEKGYKLPVWVEIPKWIKDLLPE